VQISPGAHPASYAMGTGLCSEVKQPGHGVHHPLLCSTEVKERVELCLYPLSSMPSWQIVGCFTFTLLALEASYVCRMAVIKGLNQLTDFHETFNVLQSVITLWQTQGLQKWKIGIRFLTWENHSPERSLRRLFAGIWRKLTQMFLILLW
jgi:hypothetical protein